MRFLKSLLYSILLILAVCSCVPEELPSSNSSDNLDIHADTGDQEESIADRKGNPKNTNN